LMGDGFARHRSLHALAWRQLPRGCRRLDARHMDLLLFSLMSSREENGYNWFQRVAGTIHAFSLFVVSTGKNTESN
jgi:hypothetical protein